MKQEPSNTNASLSIDFLPARYREECAQRRTKLWRMVAVSTFVVMVSVGMVIQYKTKSKLEAELAALIRLHEVSCARTVKLEILQAESKTLRARADLISYLRHPWPRTQILSAVLGPLPESITISELLLTTEGLDGAPADARRRQSRPKTSKSTDETKVDPAVADLKQLRQMRDTITVSVILSGQADDDSELHSYLREISAHPIIQKAEVSSIEQAHRDQAGSSFRARVVIRNGYGQPGGPTKFDSKEKTPKDPVVKHNQKQKPGNHDRASIATRRIR